MASEDLISIITIINLFNERHLHIDLIDIRLTLEEKTREDPIKKRPLLKKKKDQAIVSESPEKNPVPAAAAVDPSHHAGSRPRMDRRTHLHNHHH